METRGGTLPADVVADDPEQWEACVRNIRIALQDPVVQHLLARMEDSGCNINPNKFFTCAPCPGFTHGGYWDPEEGIVICQNHLRTPGLVKETMRHELIHAYDQCTMDVDWTNCLHHACTEIRAAHLSGDCMWVNEVLRGRLGIRRQQQDCIRHRAILSLSMNPFCNGDKAPWAVDQAWKSCHPDTRPFGFVP